ncbi:MAG: glycoside hydrolase family 31 protein, partial [Clostridia bacterium]
RIRGNRFSSEMFGYANIHDGLMSSDGVTVVDDSKTVLLEADGTVSPRKENTKDKYVFAFGDDYQGGLKEYYQLTGFTPLLPKYALGNWWSRYYEYSEKSYLGLMDKFDIKDVPLTVATIDMDWHIVKNVPRDATCGSMQGRGWTGYTFEKEYFPDYKRFLAELKKRGLAITMNLHPRDGVRYFEQQYNDMAEANGIDPATKQQVQFNLTDEKFVTSYFDILHHPYEADGVDFWWIDWQQGTKSTIKGLDPLWLLNHYHTLDSGRDGRQPLILSRYAGLGSHRYPIGFSGDTIVSWKSLKLQPHFTAMAANVGYTWWSHDIGGHMCGKSNGELYLRWLQFGVFSPINRLHSTKNGMSKEPWLYGKPFEEISEDFLRLRHRMLPYLYTANVLTAKEGAPLVAPMYYRFKDENAYKFKNQYCFGSEMFVAPIVSKAHANGKTMQTVWFPKGVWTNFFNGKKYEGERTYEIVCPFEEFPVFVKEGAIIPMIIQREGNSTAFDEIEVKVYLGNNSYTMYDETGSINFQISTNGENATFDIKPSLNCKTKHIKVLFCDIKGADIAVNGKPMTRGKEILVLTKQTKIVLSKIVEAR